MCRLPVLLMGLAVSLGACARNPVTGKPEFSLVPEPTEIALGKDAAADVLATVGAYADPELESYVSGKGLSLARSSERPDLPWSFHVLDDAAVNAFALPGGQIFVTRGMLTYLTSEAELAAVLGHEIGHVTAKHSVAMLSRAELAQLGLGLGSILYPDLERIGGAIGAGLSLLFLQYSRDAERQADQLGLHYALARNYDVRAMTDLFAMLDGVGKKKEARLPAWLSTHPTPENRRGEIEKRIAALQDVDWSRLVLGRDPYLKAIDGVVFGPDYAQGYFMGSTFVHPALQFQVEFPRGWQLENQARAVLAMSPDEDALLKLGVVNGLSPEDASAEFFGTSGVTALETGRPLAGRQGAVSRYFVARTQKGERVGLVSFFPFGGRTYELLGYTAAQKLDRHDDVLRATLASFARVTDPKLLDVRPAKLAIVRLHDPMTLREFDEHDPSAIDLETLALINGVKADAPLPAGTQVKRVERGRPPPSNETSP